MTIPSGLRALIAIVVRGDDIAQLLEALHRHVVFDCSVLSQRLDHRLGHWKRRLAEAKLVDEFALTLQLLGALVDSQRRGRSQIAHRRV